MSENNNVGSCDAPLVYAVVLVEDEDDDERPQQRLVTGDQPDGKQQRSWFWIGLFMTINVIAVSIAVPLSIYLLNGAGETEPTGAPVTSAPVTAAPVTAAPVTASPVTAAPTYSPQELADLIHSRLPSLSFDNTTSPESRTLGWMVEVDTTNLQTLSDDQLIQRFAIAAIGMSINGFENLVAGWSECDRGRSFVVKCNSSGEVNQIHALGLSLSGSIPVSIGLLTNIERLDLSFNALTGSIPSEVGELTALSRLCLHRNQLTGTIPSKVGRLTVLQYFGLNDNALTGMVPSEVGGLTALTSLYLGGNNLTGSIPSEVGSLTSLAWLGLARNDFTGTIPVEVGDLTWLKGLYLYNNKLNGTMPAGVCGRTSPEIDCDEIVCDCCVVSVPFGQQCR